MLHFQQLKQGARSSLAGGSETPLIVPERIFLTTKARTIWHENGMVTIFISATQRPTFLLLALLLMGLPLAARMMM
jgi:hypothetical protein